MVLEAGEEVERSLRSHDQPFFNRRGNRSAEEFAASRNLILHWVGFHPPEYCCFGPAEAEVKRVSLHFRGGETNGARVAECGELIDDRTARITETQEFGDLVEGFAGSVIASAAQEAVAMVGGGFKKVSVATRSDQSDGGEFNWCASLPAFEKNGVDVSLDVVYRDERDAGGEGDRLCISEPDEQRTGKAGAGSRGHGLKIVESNASLAQSFADYRNDSAQVFAGSKFGNDAAIFAVDLELAGDNGGQNFGFTRENSGCGFIAGRFDGQKQRIIVACGEDRPE
jgi:hypothetical protein